MIKFTKNLLFNPAEICISGIRCNFNNIAKISTIFDFKWTEVTIDSVKEGSSLLEFVKVQGLKYFIRHHSSGNIEMSVVVPCPLFEVFLDKAIKENPENIFMLNLLEPAGNICLQLKTSLFVVRTSKIHINHVMLNFFVVFTCFPPNRDIIQPIIMTTERN